MKRLLRHPVFTDKRKRFRIPRIVAGIVFSAAPFCIIFRKIDPEKLFTALGAVSWWSLPALLFFSFTAMVLQGTRWWILIRAFTRQLSWLRALSLHFTSSFYSLFIPNSTMQEVLRSVVASKHVGAVVSWSSAWVNKITGVVAAFAFSVAGILFLPAGTLPPKVTGVVGVLFVIMVILLIVSFSKTASRPLRRLASKVIPPSLQSFIAKLHEGIYQFRNKTAHLIVTMGVTFLVQFSIVFAITLLIRGITGRFLLVESLAFIPLIEMISLAQPFTPNGAGVREALVAIMFSRLGLSQEQLGVYIILANMSIFLRLIGAIPVVVDRVRHRK